MSTIAFDQFALTRIADFARSLSRLHQASRHRLVDDDQIDREFNAVCLSVWGYTTDDFSDDLFSTADHAWLDTLDEAHARIFAAEQGYDLIDDQGMLTDWWGYCWMILAEKRGLLTPENRAAARAAIEERYLSGRTSSASSLGVEGPRLRHSGMGVSVRASSQARRCTSNRATRAHRTSPRLRGEVDLLLAMQSMVQGKSG